MDLFSPVVLEARKASTPGCAVVATGPPARSCDGDEPFAVLRSLPSRKIVEH